MKREEKGRGEKGRGKEKTGKGGRSVEKEEVVLDTNRGVHPKTIRFINLSSMKGQTRQLNHKTEFDVPSLFPMTYIS